MSYQQLIDDYVPMHEPPDVHINAKALQQMAEGLHYDTTPGEVSPDFAFVMSPKRSDRPRPVYRWQRSLPGVRIVPGPLPRPRAGGVKKALVGAA